MTCEMFRIVHCKLSQFKGEMIEIIVPVEKHSYITAEHVQRRRCLSEKRCNALWDAEHVSGDRNGIYRRVLARYLKENEILRKLVAVSPNGNRCSLVVEWVRLTDRFRIRLIAEAEYFHCDTTRCTERAHA